MSCREEQRKPTQIVAHVTLTENPAAFDADGNNGAPRVRGWVDVSHPCPPFGMRGCSKIS